MPFTSSSQMKKCFSLKSKGKNGSWNCDEWAHATKNIKSLPMKVKHLRGNKQKGGNIPSQEELWKNYPPLPQASNTPFDMNEYLWGNPSLHPQNIDYSQGEYNLPRERGVPMDYSSPNMQTMQPIQDYNPFTPKPPKDKIDPYFALKGFTTGSEWLSGIVDRGRQNNYMQNQFSTLGQHQGMPVQDFQPNPFSLYAKYGGNIKQYQQGGQYHQQGQNQMAQMVQQCVQELQHGVKPQQILQELAHSGVPQQEGTQIIQAAMQQLQQGAQQQQPQQGQQQEEQALGGMYKGGGWIQKATKNMRKDHPCTGSKFGSSTCPAGSKRYNLAKTFKKMAKD